MKIRMLRQHMSYKVGDVVELPDVDAASLIAWDYAKEVTDQQRPLVETAAVEPRSERADVTPQKRRK